MKKIINKNGGGGNIFALLNYLIKNSPNTTKKIAIVYYDNSIKINFFHTNGGQKMERKELKINVMPTEKLKNEPVDKNILDSFRKWYSEATKKQELLEEEKLLKK